MKTAFQANALTLKKIFWIRSFIQVKFQFLWVVAHGISDCHTVKSITIACEAVRL